MYKITLNSPHTGKGEVITVAGLGELVNGVTTDFENSVEDKFRDARSYIEFDEDGVPKVVRGQTLRQTFQNHPYIKVEFVKDEPTSVNSENGGGE